MRGGVGDRGGSVRRNYEEVRRKVVSRKRTSRRDEPCERGTMGVPSVEESGSYLDHNRDVPVEGTEGIWSA